MATSSYKKELYFLVAYIFLCIYIFFSTAPSVFPVNTVFTVRSGASLSSVTEELNEKSIIRSSFLFRSLVILLGGEKRVIAGDYALDKRDTAFQLAYRFVHGDFHLEQVKVTIPEGWNIYQIAEYVSKQIPGFDSQKFIEIARAEKMEGYLFPDTYFLSPHITPRVLVDTMFANFKYSTARVPELQHPSRSLTDIITMASIVEAEAQTTKDRQIVAGILWNRIKQGMLLQVDSTFMYINGKNTYEVTLADLKINSPYNTYVYRGLPPTPINNPGLDSIRATLSPIQTDNLFFFSNREGTLYYAKTYEQHKKNISQYGNK